MTLGKWPRHLLGGGSGDILSLPPVWLDLLTLGAAWPWGWMTSGGQRAGAHSHSWLSGSSGWCHEPVVLCPQTPRVGLPTLLSAMAPCPEEQANPSAGEAGGGRAPHTHHFSVKWGQAPRAAFGFLSLVTLGAGAPKALLATSGATLTWKAHCCSAKHGQELISRGRQEGRKAGALSAAQTWPWPYLVRLHCLHDVHLLLT